MFELTKTESGLQLRGMVEGTMLLEGAGVFQLHRPGGLTESLQSRELFNAGRGTCFVLDFTCGLQLAGRLERREGALDAAELHLTLKNFSPDSLRFALVFELAAAEPCEARWMIPALFYKENCPEGNIRLYPRYDARTFDPEKWISPRWSFRADRSSHPGVFLFASGGSAYVGTCADTSLGLAGVYFNSPEGEAPRFGLRFPYVEAPRTYANCHDPEQKPVETFAQLEPGQKVELRIELALGPADLHFYHPVLKARYERERPAYPTQPWVDPEEAIRLCAEGLYRWHYDPRERVIYETCSFDKYFGQSKQIPGMPYVDRPHMHVGWVSGAPSAANLLRSGMRMNRPEWVKAGTNVLDRIAKEGLSPCGLFWSQWTHEAGWGTGWNPKPNWLQGRTAAEAVLFFLKALKIVGAGPCSCPEIEKQEGRSHPDWERAVRSNLDAIVKVQRPDGNLGSYYDCQSGQVEVWEGAGSILWIPALLDAADSFAEPRYADAARLAGEYYRSFVEDEYIYGAPEDVHLTPTSEDGYNALLAYWALYRAGGLESDLALARKAADWTLSYRWCYNLKFSPNTILGKYDFRTQGGDLASPCNQHLHPYGLICFPEMIELAKATGDDYYRNRAMDHLECFLQFIAREDGDFGARLGMTPEQFYHTDWWQPKGHLLALAHAWTSGLILHACLDLE